MNALTAVNLLSPLPDAYGSEVFTPLLARPGIRIERIVSQGQTTPIDAPYIQRYDEWVLLLSGEATLWLDGQGEISLTSGEALLIPANVAHRVTYTQAAPATVWLAIHFES